MDGGDAVWGAMMCGFNQNRVVRLLLVVHAICLLLAFAERTEAQRHHDPCSLLSDTEVRLIQGYAPAQKTSSEQPAGSFQFMQCFYRTPEFSNSVSVALGVPLATDSKRFGPRQYWRTQFIEKVKPVPGRKKKEPPKRVTGLGDEAFWVGDPVASALYILKGEVFLRVSVGGPIDQAEKIKRARALAMYALKRLDTSGPRKPQTVAQRN